MTTPEFTVAVLLYGDHPDLAERCLGPLWPLQRSGLIDLRIGMNECSFATAAYVDRNRAAANVVREIENIHKYPMMRKLRDAAPLKSFWMWFDDDSYISHPNPVEWLAGIKRRLQGADVVGQLWKMALSGNQHEWIRRRDWYVGKEVRARQTISFPQGGWWATASANLLNNDWPDPDIERKGGDVMFGEMCRQQGLRISDVGMKYEDVRINADKEGRHSRSKTRGPMPLPKPVGYDYQPPNLSAPRT